MKSLFSKSWRAVVLAGGMLAAPVAFGNSVGAVQFNFGPAGSPTMTALFQNEGANQVQLTISALGAGNFSLDSLYFNFNPDLDSKNLTFDQTGSVGGVQGHVSTANNAYKVSGGSGKFDINLTFGDSPTFITGDTLTFNITGEGGLSVDDFLFQETASAGNCPRYAAGSLQELEGIVVVQGTPQMSEPSESQAVPDVASTSGLLVLGLMGIGWVKRKFKS